MNRYREIKDLFRFWIKLRKFFEQFVSKSRYQKWKTAWLVRFNCNRFCIYDR